jgi:FkbM family methyltransferase
MLKRIRSRASQIIHRRTDNRTVLPETGWIDLERRGFRWHLSMDRYIDRQIATKGTFEPATTELVLKFVKPGMTVLDVGANIGYFTLLFGRQVGPSGRVWAFEPVKRYQEAIKLHLQTNRLDDTVQLLSFGLSDRTLRVPISVDEFGASMHSASSSTTFEIEEIDIARLDDVVREQNINKVDFIKLDIDGHEPAFVRGAQSTIRSHMPVMVLEFAQAWLDVAGEDARTLKTAIEELGYTLYSEKTRQAFSSRLEFLRECGNYTHSANVWAIPSAVVVSNVDRLDDILIAYPGSLEAKHQAYEGAIHD